MIQDNDTTLRSLNEYQAKRISLYYSYSLSGNIKNTYNNKIVDLIITRII